MSENSEKINRSLFIIEILEISLVIIWFLSQKKRWFHAHQNFSHFSNLNLCVYVSQYLNSVSDFLNSCEHSLNAVRLSKHAKPSLAFSAVSSSKGPMHYVNWQQFLKCHMAIPAKPRFWATVGNEISVRKETNVNHVWDDVVWGTPRWERRILSWKECSFWTEFSDVSPFPNVKKSVLSECKKDLFIF